MKKNLVKSFLILSAMLVIIGLLPVSQTSASSDVFETQVIPQQTSSDVQIEFNASELVYGNEEDLSIVEVYKSEGLTDDLITPFAEIGPTYPGTNVAMRIGDVLYSTKSLDGSSAFVGHVGIVNSNFKVVHVTPVVNGGVVDTLTTYRGRHGVGETIKVYRPRDGKGVEAAKWAVYNYSKVTNYFINPLGLLGTLNPNYCSKFIWQAFYYGEGIDLYNNGAGNPNKPGLVTPSSITSSNQLVYTTQFKSS
ncbi:hypothetical protein [Paenibacillus xylanexedens]|uniref:hypothetical protein n=1 Tax=Paenibacillus xylanexedens TaxID=528191 RepID=UPI003CFE37A0